MTTDKLCAPDLCTGCFTCKQVCAKGAIHITEVKGFLYPEIDPSICVDCGLCSKICPVLTPISGDELQGDNNSVSYAIWNRDVNDRINSSSGGTFSALANRILKQGGVVYGAAWDDDMHLRHIGIEDVDELDSLRRSKYVQSNTDGIYINVKKQLTAERKVLFCGTPCQIAGLLSFLGKKDYPNLITAGVVCHGVPSQRLFDDYLHSIEEKESINIYNCNFRSKEYGWRTGLNLVFQGKKRDGKLLRVNMMGSGNAFFRSFLKKYFLRESCYNCPFKEGENKCHADIMLSDAWSLWANVPWKEFDFSKGISAVATYSDKGKDFLNQCSDALVIKERPYSEYASNSGLRSSRKPQNNDIAYEYLKTHTWKKTQSMYFPLRLTDYFSDYSRVLLGENRSVLVKKFLSRIKIKHI